MKQIGLNVPLFQSHGFGNIKYVAGRRRGGRRHHLPLRAPAGRRRLPDDHPQKAAPDASTRRTTRAKYKEDVSTFGGHAYDALLILVEAIKKAGAPTGEGPRRHREPQGLRRHRRASSTSRPTDHNGLDMDAFEMLTVKDGKFALYEEVTSPGGPASHATPRVRAWTLEQIVAVLSSPGITVGSIYAIVAIGFNIIYNTTGIINFAQGEFLMLGGMTAVTPVAVPAAAAGHRCWRWSITTLLGGLVELVFIRRARDALGAAPDHHHHRPLDPDPGGRAARLGREGPRRCPTSPATRSPRCSVLGAHISPQVLWVLGICAVDRRRR